MSISGIAPLSIEVIGLVVAVLGLFYAAVSHRASVSQDKRSINPIIGVDTGRVTWGRLGKYIEFICPITVHNSGLGNAFKVSLDFTLHYTRTEGPARGGHEHCFGKGALIPGESSSAEFRMPLIDAWMVLNDYKKPALTIVASWEDGAGEKYDRRIDYLVFHLEELNITSLRVFRKPSWFLVQIRKLLGDSEPTRSLPV